ncbi:hypothetical protein LEMLEM_LOCUS4785 [Lemmus lemmus]
MEPGPMKASWQGESFLTTISLISPCPSCGVFSNRVLGSSSAVHLQSSIQLCICSHRYHRQQEHGSWASICFLVPE